jgi:hypothetical protein
MSYHIVLRFDVGALDGECLDEIEMTLRRRIVERSLATLWVEQRGGGTGVRGSGSSGACTERKKNSQVVGTPSCARPSVAGEGGSHQLISNGECELGPWMWEVVCVLERSVS